MSEPQETIETTVNQPAGDSGAATPTPEVDNAPPVKRGRGRPPKNASAGTQKETVTGEAPRRGRPPKSGSKKVYSADDISLMGKQLVGLHIMIAQISGMPEMAIAEQEGALLAQSIVNVADQYDLAIDGKTGAALQLAMTAAMIYGPRALAIRARARAATQNVPENGVQ